MLEGGRKCREVANVGKVYVQTAYLKYFRLSHVKIGAACLEHCQWGYCLDRISQMCSCGSCLETESKLYTS